MATLNPERLYFDNNKTGSGSETYTTVQFSVSSSGVSVFTMWHLRGTPVLDETKMVSYVQARIERRKLMSLGFRRR